MCVQTRKRVLKKEYGKREILKYFLIQQEEEKIFNRKKYEIIFFVLYNI